MSGSAARTRSDPLTQLSLDDLRRRTSMKWRAHPEDVLPLWVAEMDVPMAPAVADALREVIRLGDTGYPAGTAYAEAVSDFASRRWGWDGLDPARTAVVPDVMMGAVELLRLVTIPEDIVVVTPPVYAPFYAFVTHADRRMVDAPLTPAGRLDLTTLEAAFRLARQSCPNPALLLSNPHNPTGVAHTREELEGVSRLAEEYAVRVVSDEIHAPLVLDGAAFTPYLSVAGTENAFALVPASKAWNLAGLKAAVAVAGPAAADDLARMPEEVSHGPSHVGVLTHTAAFRDGGEWLDELLAGLRRTATCSATSWPSICPGRGSTGRRRPSWRGSIASRSGCLPGLRSRGRRSSATSPDRPGTSSTTPGSRSAPGTSSARVAVPMCA